VQGHRILDVELPDATDSHIEQQSFKGLERLLLAVHFVGRFVFQTVEDGAALVYEKRHRTRAGHKTLFHCKSWEDFESRELSRELIDGAWSLLNSKNFIEARKAIGPVVFSHGWRVSSVCSCAGDRVT
jgi:hypothetical protein